MRHVTRSLIRGSLMLLVTVGTIELPATAVAAQRPASAGEDDPQFLLAATITSEPAQTDARRTPTLDRRLSLDLRDVPLKQALAEISRQGGLDLAYANDLVPADRRVTLQAERITVAEALANVLADTGIDVVFTADGRATLVPRATPAPTASSTTTGLVLGRIVDRTATPLPGVTIRLRSEHRVDPYAAATDSNGNYRIGDIAPDRYTLTAELLGFAAPPVEVAVRVGSTTRVNIEMASADFEEAVEVSDIAPQIEIVESQVNKYISFEEIQNLPLQNRTFLDVLRTVPGVQTGVPAGTLNSRGPNNSFNIHGARSNQNNFLIDGVSNNDRSDLNYEDVASVQVLGGPRSSTGAGLGGSTFQVGTALQTFNLDAIQEVQVATSLFSAEYGSGSGGVINVVTRSGTDVLSAGATVQRQTDAFVSEPPQEFTRNQASFALGGPLVRGKTHFFATYEYDEHDLGYNFNESAFVTPRVLEGLDLTANETRRDRLTLKLAQKFAAAHNFTFTTNYIDERADVLNSIFRASLDDLVPEDHANESLGFVARDLLVLRGTMDLESVIGYSTTDREFDSGFDDPRRLRLEFDPAGDLIFIAIGTNSPDTASEITSFNWAEKLSIADEDRLWKLGVGVDYFKQDTFQVDYLAWSYSFGTFDDLPTSGLHIPETNIEASVTDVYAFVQNDWYVLPATTLNLGLRLGHNNLFGADTVEPRVGVAHDVFGNSRSVLRAGVGYYHDRANLIGNTGAARPPVELGVADPATGEFVPSGPPSEVVLDEDIELPGIIKWVIGYEQQIGARTVLGAHVFGNHYRDLFYTEFLNRPSPLNNQRPDPSRGRIDLYTNSGKADVYDLELQFRHNFANGSLVQASYTYQDTNGNSAFDFVSGNSPLNFLTANEELPPREQVEGPLDYEVEHSFKLSGVFTLPWGFQFSTFVDWRTGLPFTIRDTWFLTTPGGSVPGGFLVDSYNSRRLPNWFNMDVRLAKTFTIGDRHDLQVFFDVFNVTNRENVLEVQGRRRTYFGPDPFDREAPEWTPVDTYLEPRTRSAARSAQVGLRWSM